MTKLHIFQLLPQVQVSCSGVLPVVASLSRKLAEKALKVTVGYTPPWPGRGQFAQSELEPSGLDFQALPTGTSKLATARAAAKSIDAKNYDLIHLHNVLAPSNGLVARHLQTPFLISPHDTCAPSRQQKSAGRKWLYRQCLGLPMMKKSVGVCVLNEKERRDVGLYGYAGPTYLLPNGVELPADSIGGSSFRKELGIGSQTPLALYAGRMDVHYKRIDAMINVVAGTKDWHLALVGPDEGNSRAVIRAKIEETGTEDRIHRVAPRFGKELWKTFAAADVLLLLSKTEGLSRTLLEALAVGTPAVVSPAVGETLQLGEAGWVVEDHEAVELLRGLTSQPKHLDMRGLEALALARQFNWGQIAEQYLEILCAATATRR